MRLVLIALLCAPMLSGCAAGFIAMEAMKASGKFEQAPPPQGKALVYVYRTASMTMAARGADFYANDKKMFSLATGGYAYAYLAPGHYEIAQTWGTLPWDIGKVAKPVVVSLDVAAGQTRYVRLSADTQFGGMFYEQSWGIREVSATLGTNELPGEHLDATAVAGIDPAFRQ